MVFLVVGIVSAGVMFVRRAQLSMALESCDTVGGLDCRRLDGINGSQDMAFFFRPWKRFYSLGF